jgi:hypothetical protein
MGIPSTQAYKELNHILMGTALAASTNIAIGLFSVASSDSTTVLGTELSGNGYGRIQTTGWTFLSRQASNTTAITFPVATGTWSSVVAFGVFDSTANGNLLRYGALDVFRQALAGDQLTFASSAIVIQYLGSTDI